MVWESKIFIDDWFIMKTVWHFQVDLNAILYYKILNTSTWCWLFDTQTTCAKNAGTHIYIYRKLELDLSTSLSVGALLKSNAIQSYDIPLSEIILHGNLLHNHWGCGWQYIAIKVHGQSRSTVPRSPGSGILVPCRHGQIFMAAQVWHGMSQTLVLGHSSEQLAWQEQLESASSELPVLQVQEMRAACMVQCGWMQVVLLRSSG